MSEPDYGKFLPDIDIAGGIKRVMNNEKIYLMLLKKFKPAEMAGDIIVKIKDGASPDEIRNAAHALKGAAANLSTPVIAEAARLIEEEAKKGNDGAEHIPALGDALMGLEEKLKLLPE